MTTILGLKAERGKNKGVILASDMSSTYEFRDDKGDVIIKRQGRTQNQKIYMNNKGDFVVAMSGIRDDRYGDFLSELLKGKIDLCKCLKESYFPELSNLNLNRWNHTEPNKEVNELLIASRFNKEPKLYMCYMLGKIDEVANLGQAIGSGKDFALRYASDNIGNLDPGHPGINLKKAIKVAYGAIERASEDIYTGGADIAIVTPDEIKQYGKQINDPIKQAKRNALEKILKEY